MKGFSEDLIKYHPNLYPGELLNIAYIVYMFDNTKSLK